MGLAQGHSVTPCWHRGWHRDTPVSQHCQLCPQREETKECVLQGAGIYENASLQGPGWADVIVPRNLGCSRVPVMAAVVSGVFVCHK